MSDLNRAAQFLTPEQITEFRSHIDMSDPTGHWPWRGDKTPDGKPIWSVQVNGETVVFPADWLSLWLHQHGK